MPALQGGSPAAAPPRPPLAVRVDRGQAPHMNRDLLLGIRRRLTVIAIGVLAIAVVDFAFLLTHLH